MKILFNELKWIEEVIGVEKKITGYLVVFFFFVLNIFLFVFCADIYQSPGINDASHYFSQSKIEETPEANDNNNSSNSTKVFRKGSGIDDDDFLGKNSHNNSFYKEFVDDFEDLSGYSQGSSSYNFDEYLHDKVFFARINHAVCIYSILCSLYCFYLFIFF
jgi:hypothetical protein